VIPGDVIVGVNGEEVEDAADLYDLLSDRRVGERVKIRVTRDGAEREVEIALGELPPD
jgi:S1-C subfamily serine protease